MKRRIIVTGIVAAIAHFLVLTWSVMTAFGLGMDRFDNPDLQPTLSERVADVISTILFQPFYSLDALDEPGHAGFRRMAFHFCQQPAVGFCHYIAAERPQAATKTRNLRDGSG